MFVQMRSITSIRPYEDNLLRNDQGMNAVVAPIHKYGLGPPIVVDDAGVIVVGHTLYKAALKVGLTEVPVRVATGLSPAGARACRLADKQTASLAPMHDERLLLELAELMELYGAAYHRRFEAEAKLKKFGPILKSAQGGLYRSPYLDVMIQATKETQRIFRGLLKKQVDAVMKDTALTALERARFAASLGRATLQATEPSDTAARLKTER